MSQAFDYRGWVERAKAFTERCHRLPGEVGVAAEVAPPMSAEDVDSIAKTLPRGIPKPVLRFLIEGSGDCHCKYTWHPVPPAAPREATPFHSVFELEMGIYGGADLCNPIAKGRRQIGEGLFSIDRAGFLYLQTACKDLGEVMESVEERKLFQDSVPFLDMANGDMIALHGDREEVVYLSHEGYDISCRIAPSFEEFLERWEQLCYIGPEIWLLGEFRDKESGFIDAQCNKGIELRRIFDRLLA